jgi:hypothetical protein
MIKIGDVLIINKFSNARIEEIHSYYKEYKYDDIVGIFLDLNDKVEINKNIYGIKGNVLYTYELINIEFDEIKDTVDLYYEQESEIESNKLAEKEALFIMMYSTNNEDGLSDEQIKQMIQDI